MAKKSQRQVGLERDIEREVREIFEMFRALKSSYETLPDKSGIDESVITFDGFDANDSEEFEYLQAARRLARISRDIQVFNSHFPVLRGYQKMVQAWRNSRDKDNLTREDILRIIGQ